MVILVSCTAVFYILRNHPPSDNERANRRQRNRYQHQSVPTLSSFNYNNSSTPSQSLSGSLGRMFGIKGRSDDSNRNDGTKVKMGKGGQGWVQAGSGDEWDDDSGDERRRTEGLPQLREVSGQVPQVGLSPAFDKPFSTTIFSSYPTSESNSSDRVDLHALPGLSYKDGQSPSPQSTLPNIHTQISSASSSGAPSPAPIRTASPEPIPGSSTDNLADKDGRKFSTQSVVSVRTFQGGTKFIESL